MKPEFECADSAREELSEAAQDRLARILDDYLVAAEQGAPISPDELLLTASGRREVFARLLERPADVSRRRG